MKVAEAKLALLDCTLEHFLAVYPSTKRVHPVLGLRVYPIARTPFVVLYDFDDQQLRVHFIFLAGAPLDNFDPKSAVW